MIDGNFDDVALRTFKVSLPAEHDLRKSLTRKPVRSVRHLMDHTDVYKRVEEDQQQGKGKANVFPSYPEGCSKSQYIKSWKN